MFLRQLWLVLRVKLMEININLFSRLVVLIWNSPGCLDQKNVGE